MRLKITLLTWLLTALLVAACSPEVADPSDRLEATEVPAGAPTRTSTSAPNAMNTQEPTPRPTNTPLPTATQTPVPVGQSRGNPAPMGETVVVGGWEIRINEMVRGEEAWQMIQAANMFNEPAPEAMEYLLVRIYAKSNHSDDEEHSIGEGDFKVTGDQYWQYASYDVGVVSPSPALDAELFSGGETEGWASFAVHEGEENLLLIVDELLNFSEDRFRYIALEEGATVTVPEGIAGLDANELGTSRSQPAPLGETVATDSWQITVSEVIRGDSAWNMIAEANQFNDPPADGMEYVLARLIVRNISSQDSAEVIDSSSFSTTGSANTVHDTPTIVEPEPILDHRLYPGGEAEGWIALQAAEGEENLMIIFEPFFSTGERRFLSLETE